MWTHPALARLDTRLRARVTTHIQANARRYYPEFSSDEVRVRVTGVIRRSNTLLLRIDLLAGSLRHEVVTKVHTGEFFSRGQPLAHWPRLAPCPNPEDAGRSEFEALSAVHSRFQALDVPGLGAVRPLDFLAVDRTLILEAAPPRSLQSLLLRHHRLASLSARSVTEESFRNAGRWLRQFQAIPDLARGGEYRSRCDDVVASIRELGEFLVRHGQEPDFVRRIASETEAYARAYVPDQPPLALNHGDYWPGNILVGPGHRVTAIDTHAWWRTPVYEDIGYFLANLETAPVQVFTLGRFFDPATISTLETAFLRGFFGKDPVTIAPIRVFEVFAILNKWAISAHECSRARGLSRLAKNRKLVVRKRFFMRLLDRVTGELRGYGSSVGVR
jgi:hypothetical protein